MKCPAPIVSSLSEQKATAQSARGRKVAGIGNKKNNNQTERTSFTLGRCGHWNRRTRRQPAHGAARPCGQERGAVVRSHTTETLWKADHLRISLPTIFLHTSASRTTELPSTHQERPRLCEMSPSSSYDDDFQEKLQPGVGELWFWSCNHLLVTSTHGCARRYRRCCRKVCPNAPRGKRVGSY